MAAALTRIAIVLSVASLARAESLPAYGGRIVVALPSRPQFSDPLLAHSSADIALVGLLYDTLYEIDAQGAGQPHLARGEPEVIDNGLAVRIAIRQPVPVRSGQILSRDDVVASLRRALA